MSAPRVKRTANTARHRAAHSSGCRCAVCQTTVTRGTPEPAECFDCGRTAPGFYVVERFHCKACLLQGVVSDHLLDVLLDPEGCVARSRQNVAAVEYHAKRIGKVIIRSAGL